MLIHLQPSRNSLKNRLIYLLEGTENSPRPSDKVEVLYGDPATFSLIHQSHSREVKYFNLLITFKENKDELLFNLLAKHRKTLKDLHDEILSYLLPYDLKELNLLTVAHSDTDHYHWHITIDNQHLGTGKALYLPRTKLTIRLYDRLRRYISAKYGISLGVQQPYSTEVGTKKLIEKLKEKGKEGTTLKKEQVKELITEQIRLLILSGDINSRKDIEDYIEQVLGLEINRRGKSYISIRYGKTKIRLSGGIYDEQRFGQVAEEIRRGTAEDLCEPPERVGELERELRELVEKYRELVRKRISPSKQKTQKLEFGDRREFEPSGTNSTSKSVCDSIQEAGQLDRRDAEANQGYVREEIPGSREESERSREANQQADRRTLNTKGESAVKDIHKHNRDSNSNSFASRLYRWRSVWLEGREKTWDKNGRGRVSGEAGRAGEDGEELQTNQTRMDKALGDSNCQGQARKFSLSKVQYSDRYFGKWGKKLAGGIPEILHSVRPSSPAPYRTVIQKQYSEAVVDWELKRQEELEAIKRLPPEVVLGDLGIGAKRVGHRLCIYAPWREETKPSVFIEQKENGHYVWKDFGSGRGGTWIDFFMELYGWDYVEAVKELRERYLGADIELVNEMRKSSENSFSFGSRKYELVELKATKVQHPALLRYLKERKIEKVPDWLKEVHYTLKDRETGELKEYFALGVQTLSGSWILRNPFVKMNLRTSDDQEHTFAYIRNGNKRLVIVEGLFDALSVHQIARRDDFDLIILSGIGNADEFIRSEIYQRYDEIIVATDNDKAGEEFFKRMRLYVLVGLFEGKSVSLKRLKPTCKDLNEALQKGEKIKLIDYTEKLKEYVRKKIEKTTRQKPEPPEEPPEPSYPRNFGPRM